MTAAAPCVPDPANRKLAPRYYGPYQVLERIGLVAYRLQLPPMARIHNVFHMVFLKKHKGDPPAMVPPPTIARGRALPAPDSIVCARLNRGTPEVLVRWTGRAAADSTWEPLDSFKEA